MPQIIQTTKEVAQVFKSLQSLSRKGMGLPIGNKSAGMVESVFKGESLGFLNLDSFKHVEGVGEILETSSQKVCAGWSEMEAFIEGKVKLIDFNTLLGRQTPKVRQSYKELQQIMIGRDPVKNNDTKKLTIMANRYLRNSDYVNNEQEMLLYLDRIKFLMGKTTPKGEPLLGVRFIDYLTNSRSNKIPQQKFNELARLVKAAEKGYIPKETFWEGPWFEFADGVNPKILRDIEKVAEARKEGMPLIEKFIPNRVKNHITWKDMKTGEMYEELGGGVGMVDDKGCWHKLSDLNRDDTFRMFFPISRYYSAQNQAGTCYALAAYDAIISSPRISAYLTRCISKKGNNFVIKMPKGSTPNNIFAGKFPNFSQEGSVLTQLNGVRYNAIDTNMTTRSNSLIQALETLYGTHRKYTMADEYVRYIKSIGGDYRKEFNYLMNNMDRTIIRKSSDGKYYKYSLDEYFNYQKNIFNYGTTTRKPKNYKCADDYYKEAGCADEIFNFFLRGRCKVKKTPTTDINAVRKSLQESEIACFSSLSKPNKTDSDFIDVSKSLAYGHAYTVVEYNPISDIVTYSNPWNNTLVYKMPLTELVKKTRMFQTGVYRWC